MFELNLRDGEEVLCHLKSHWLYDGLIVFISIFDVVMSLMTSHEALCIPDSIGWLVVIYLLVWVKWQGVIFTNRRVICRSFGFRLSEKSFALPEITLFYNPVSNRIFPDCYMLKVAEDGRKSCIGGLAVNQRQIEFMQHKYKLEKRVYWSTLWWLD